MQDWLRDLIEILKPLIELLAMTVGPVLVTWISIRLTSALKMTDNAKRVEFEAQLRAALHQAAMNGLKAAASRYGSHIFDVDGYLRPTAIAQAVQYVQEKNPDTLRELNVSGVDLVDIIASKTAAIQAIPLPGSPKKGVTNSTVTPPRR